MSKKNLKPVVNIRYKCTGCNRWFKKPKENGHAVSCTGVSFNKHVFVNRKPIADYEPRDIVKFKNEGILF